MDFGKNNDGLYLFRINGSVNEIDEAIQDLKNIGCEVWGEPFKLERAHKHWSVLVKVQIPINAEVTGVKEIR